MENLKLRTEDHQKTAFKFLSMISMIYITLMLAANVLIYKLTTLHGIHMTVGSFITPFWFVMGDMITEVYGYNAYKKLIWQAFFCSGLFTLICIFFISFPSPAGWSYEPDYEYIFGPLPRIFLGSLLGIGLGSFLNAYLISKWKILVKGRLFWVRSLCSSTIGELIFTLVTLLLAMAHHLTSIQVLHFIGTSYAIKVLLTAITAAPLTWVIKILKKAEGVDIYDYNTNFNPLKLTS